MGEKFEKITVLVPVVSHLAILAPGLFIFGKITTLVLGLSKHGKYGPYGYFGKVTVQVPQKQKYYMNGPCVTYDYKPNGPHIIF